MERLGKSNLSVYNFSVVGYNTVQELVVARSYVTALNPDHIVLGFFIGNDMISNAMTYIDEDGNYRASDDMESRVRDEIKKSFGILFHSVIVRIVALPAYVPRMRYQIAISDHVIAKSYELLLELDSLAKRSGRRFSVVILYPRDSVQGGMVEAWSNSRKAGALIHAFCQENSIEALDLIEYMNTREHEESYFFQHDGHPNKEGNGVIARAILKHLVEPHAVH